jgi:trehalose synthase
MTLDEVHVPAFPLDRFLPFVGEERFDAFVATTTRVRRLVGDRTIWNLNSTASGGGVAELLHVLLAYARGAGFDVRWLVIGGDPRFFQLTKGLHHLLHGRDPGQELTADDHDLYAAVGRRNAEELRQLLRPGDVVILHDPQTAGLVPALVGNGISVIWRCHIGSDSENDATRRGWAFLEPYLPAADAYVFSRKAYVPAALRGARTAIIPPSIDPFSAKNEDLDDETVHAVLAWIGLLQPSADDPVPRFVRHDGSPGRVDRRARITSTTAPIPARSPLVVQVSRWDPLKDMEGVMHGFAEVRDHDDVHLALVGPDVAGVTDDPEGAQILAACTQAWRSLPDDLRGRVHLVSLPMEDLEENAVMVNAIQRHAAVIVQKSLAEGFGLTVTEAMWKARPVVASAVGGIRDQIEDGRHGLLVDDPRDLKEFATTLGSLLGDWETADRLGAAARERVIDRFVGDRHLLQYGDLLTELLG